MSSVPREVYKTIKRSISSTTNGVLHAASSAVASSSSSSSNGNGARYTGGASGSKHWIHPPEVLNSGRVEYSVKMLGQTEVAQPKGTETIRDAIHRIRFNLQVNRSVTGNSGAKLQKVDLQINVDGLTVVETKSKMIMFKYPLHQISFCADDKLDKRIFSFIVKEEASSRHTCFVFLSDKLAEQITLTIGEAFDLAYQKYLSNHGRELETKKQLIVLRKRIAELEAENCQLKDRLAAVQRIESRPVPAPRTITTTEALISIPALPSSPMPKGPPPGLNTTDNSATGIGIRGLEPPPVVSRRQLQPSGTSNGNNNNSNMAIMAELTANGPDVGRRLENLQLDKMEDIFDDDFNPRATEQGQNKDVFDLDPFGESFLRDLMAEGSQTTANGLAPEVNGNSTAGTDHEPTPADYAKMISRLDARLAEMQSGFAGGQLETGDTGDAGRDLVDQGAYDTLQKPTGTRKSSEPMLSGNKPSSNNDYDTLGTGKK